MLAVRHRVTVVRQIPIHQHFTAGNSVPLHQIRNPSAHSHRQKHPLNMSRRVFVRIFPLRHRHSHQTEQPPVIPDAQIRIRMPVRPADHAHHLQFVHIIRERLAHRHGIRTEIRHSPRQPGRISKVHLLQRPDHRHAQPRLLPPVQHIREHTTARRRQKCRLNLPLPSPEVEPVVHHRQTAPRFQCAARKQTETRIVVPDLRRVGQKAHNLHAVQPHAADLTHAALVAIPVLRPPSHTARRILRPVTRNPFRHTADSSVRRNLNLPPFIKSIDSTPSDKRCDSVMSLPNARVCLRVKILPLFKSNTLAFTCCNPVMS